MIYPPSKISYFVALIFLFFTYLFKRRKQVRIRQWQRSLNLHEHAPVFQKLYQKVNGFMLSQQARKTQDAFDYVYGEINFLSFVALLSLAKPDNTTVFYDLGSGVGKAVLACAMVYSVRKSVGVELFPQLHSAACKQAEQLACIENYNKQAKCVEFILGDFLQVNLDDATMIFINSTALVNPTWSTLCLRLEHLPHLTTVITTSKPLSSTKFEVLIETQVEMSWGVVLAFIQVKKRKTTNSLENIE